MRDRLNSNECSRYLKALADPDRLKIVQCLSNGPRSVGDICRDLGAPVGNVSHHLKQLRTAGIVLARKQGRFVLYSLPARLTGAPGNRSLNVLEFGCCRLELGQK